MTSRVPQRQSRRKRRYDLDEWLLIHAVQVATEPATSLAKELRTLGHYSQSTGLGDIRLSYQKRCRKLGIPFKP